MSNEVRLAFLARTAAIIDTISEWSGRIISWLVLLMVILVVYDVSMRYFFRSGSVALQELEWHFFSLIFLLGAAYTQRHDDHVRLDLVYQSRFMNERRRAWVNIIGSVAFLIPFCILIILSSWQFVTQSFIYSEGSPDPGGLPYRWVLKAAIPAGFALLLLQGAGDLCRNIILALGRDP